MKKLLWILSGVASAALLVAAQQHWVDFSILEVLGFITGGYSVWLLVTEDILTWPVSILNALLFLVLFLQTRLFADSALQLVYIALNISGWYWWRKGAHHKKELPVTNIGMQEAITLAAIGSLATWGMYKVLVDIKDIAPLWDGLATALSLIATYMAVKKYFESWYVWLAVNLIYIGLYSVKHLVLLSILYLIYFAMTVVGLVDWKKQLLPTRTTAKEA